MDELDIILFEDKKECCGCSACKSICPKKAISMYEDEYGFEYPKIDKEKCIRCGLCKKVCAFQNIEEINIPIKTYVAVAKDEKIRLKSASGGIFAAIAQMYIKNGGVVFGVAFDNEIKPIHIGISDANLLYKLQGSKYVQSSIGDVYKEVKEFLEQGRQVLFSGTPCQVAGLKGYLIKDYDNLLTIDIICHGLPSAKFFKDYLIILEEKLCGKIKEFKFRDKNIGWGLNGSVIYQNNGKLKRKKIYGSESSYYHYFLNSDCYRESCYSCKYACPNRSADITIGDYWGIEVAHPELLKREKLHEEGGISVLITNTLNGERMAKESSMLEKYPSDFSKARIKNGQLNNPSKRGINYSVVMELYKNKGYDSIDILYNKKNGFKKYKDRVKTLIPVKFKRIIKQFM